MAKMWSRAFAGGSPISSPDQLGVNDGAKSSQRRRDASEMTETRRVTADDVAFDVPITWHERPSEEGVEYRAPDESEQLIVSVSLFKAALGPNEVDKAISALVAARQRSVS